MPYRITDACTSCDLCVDACPIGAIDPGGPIYVINDTCCDFEECLAECPENAIVRIPDDSTIGGDSAPIPPNETTVDSHS
jgi:ferredoxin